MKLALDLVRMFQEFLHNPSSLLLTLLLGPITLILIFIHHLKRVYTIGTNYINLSPFVRPEDPVLNPLLTLSAQELSKKICDKNDPLTAIILLELYIKQCELVNPLTQAVVGKRYLEARNEARNIDNEIVNLSENEINIKRKQYPFYGVPIVVKECFEMKDMPYSGGLWGRKDVIGTITGPTITKIQESGIIIYASTNISEACMYHESANHVYGTTHNPYDLRRTSGGSSGGCATAVASCCAPFAITSDVGGSTRIPALYNCLFGHKPTGGVISNENTFPSVGEKDINKFCQLGPTCRHSLDLWPLLQTMLSRNPSHPMVDEQVSVPLDYTKLTIHVCLRNLTCSWLSSTVHPEIISGIVAAAKHFESLGATVEYEFDTREDVRDMFQLANAFRIWAALMSHHKHEPFSVTIRRGLSAVMFWPLEVILSLWDLSKNTFPAVALAVLESLSDLSFMEGENQAMRDMGMRLKRTLNDILKPTNREGVLFLPSLPTPAPFHSESLVRIFDTANTSFFNVMELPATAVPLGLTCHFYADWIPGKLMPNRLPFLTIIVGASGRDRVTIALAEELENCGLCHWVPPSPIQRPVK